MIKIKRNCSSSVTDRGDKITFGSISITISDDQYIKFRELMNEYQKDPLTVLEWIIDTGLIE